ncbi:PH domain-containing protein [Jatrophihabitans sp.]|uniref:PH domain-containing protein n=1 Tax=Jatrophihabitans sp. TaxID=1932789 RepID=UPI0030C76919|nr:uncharacterized protein [Jatrophihabitans sp.]
MAYPEKVLANDEKVVEHLHPHWITLVPATFWLIVICAAGGAGIGFAPSGGAHKPVIIAIIVVGVILLFWLALSPWVRWRSTHYVITTHRVLIRRGVLRHSGRDIALQRISDVSFSQSLWDRMVGAGTLTIESAGEHGTENLTNIPRSDQQQQLLNRLIEEDGSRRVGGYAQPPQQPYQQQPPAAGQPPYPPTQPYPPQ